MAFIFKAENREYIADMPDNMEGAFQEFLKSLKSTPAELAAAASHRASIKARLDATFGMTSFFRTGSFGNGTNIAGYSDVDYFAVIPTARLKQNSDQSLVQLADTLRDRFPLTDNIRINGPAVRVPFGLDGAEATEILPVDDTGLTLLGFRKFDIPDGNGGWMFSAPDSHNAYVDIADEKLVGKVKPLVRFVKAWKFKRNVPIKSFYLEIRVAHYAMGEQSIIYDIDISRFFKLLLADRLADVPDPRFPNDAFVLRACNTELQRIDALTKLQRAEAWATRAWENRMSGRLSAAFDDWDLVFNYDFPAFTG